jgi:hypothetical protein
MNESNKRTECDAYAAVVQSVLDGERPAGALATVHAANCDDCRSLAKSARALATGIRFLAQSIATPEFTDRVVPAVRFERRRGRVIRRASVAAALAASVLFAVVVAKSRAPGDRAVAERETLPEPSMRPPPVEDSIREAGSAFVSLTKRTAAETLAPARSLLAGIERPDASPTADPPKIEGATAASPIAPITNTARRAINLFIRDVGALAPSSNRKS